MTFPSDLNTPALRTRAVAAARGAAPFDQLITGGTVFDMVTGRMRAADVGIVGPMIASVHAPDPERQGTQTIDAQGCILVPGLIDTHMHAESSMITPAAYAGAVVPRGDHAVIRVSDTGEGIPPDRIDKIFEPFFTTKRMGEGTGLGLSTAYGIVKQSGGFIFVTSAPGAGAAFELWFPVCRDAAAETVVVPRQKSRRTDAVILLVEDEAPVRAFAARALRLRGHSVLEAATAEEALTLLEDSGLHVDVFVTDVVMPGLDGPGWVRRALEQRPAVRTVFISGYAEEALADMQARVPNSVFLPKPFSLAALTETVQAQLLA